MIATDTSSFVAYLTGAAGRDVDVIDDALSQSHLVFPPIVLAEILSDPQLDLKLKSTLLQIPLLELTQGFWERAGILRSKIIVKGHKARLADSLIAQVCLDHGVPLITRDKDFRHFVKMGLLVAVMI